MDARRTQETWIRPLKLVLPTLSDASEAQAVRKMIQKHRTALESMPGERQKQSNIINFRQKKKTSKRQQLLVGMLDCSVTNSGM